MSSLRKALLAVSCFLTFSFGIFEAIGSQLDMPIVHRDSVTGKCVDVESIAGSYNCLEMPDRYEVINVAPVG